MDVLSQNLDDIWGPEISTLDVSGGSMRGPNGESELLTWGLPDQLMRSDALSLFFEEQTKSLPNGKVFDPSDLPNEIPTIELSCPPTDDQLRKLESRAHDNLAQVWTYLSTAARNTCLPPTKRGSTVAFQLCGMSIDQTACV